MSERPWLSDSEQWWPDFKDKLRNGTLKYSKQLKPIAYYAVEASDNNFADDRKINLALNVCLDIVDVAKHLKLANKSYLEAVLMHKYYIKKLLVVENDILDKFNLGYHVVYIDGIGDFVTRFYDKIDPLSGSHSADLKENVLEQPAGCLIFLNPDNSYFCAIPCLQDDKAASELHINSNYYEVDATVDQIKTILKPVPLVCIDHIYPFVMHYAHRNNMSLDHQQVDDFCAYCNFARRSDSFLVTYSGVNDNSSLKGYKTIGSYSGLIKYYLDKNKAQSIHAYLDMIDRYKDVILHVIELQENHTAYYLKKHCTFSFDDDGNIVVEFDIPVPNVTKILNRHFRTQLNNIRSWSVTELTTFVDRAYVNVANYVYNEIVHHPYNWMTIKAVEPAEVTSIDINLPTTLTNSQKASIQPLSHNDGLSDALLSLSGKTQKYYYHNQKLITFNRTNDNYLNKTMEIEGIVGKL